MSSSSPLTPEENDDRDIYDEDDGWSFPVKGRRPTIITEETEYGEMYDEDDGWVHPYAKPKGRGPAGTHSNYFPLSIILTAISNEGPP